MLSIHSLLLPRVQYRSKPNRATLEKLVTPTKGVTMLFRFCKLGRVRGGVGWGTAVLAVAAAVAFVGSVSSASAAACSTTSGASSCTVTGSLTVTAGTLSLESSPNLYWALDASGYDQWASGSSATLSGCAISGTATHCSGGVSPTVSTRVLDATGSAAGWAVSEYLSANTLPSGYALHFDGAGSSTYGYSAGLADRHRPVRRHNPRQRLRLREQLHGRDRRDHLRLLGAWLHHLSGLSGHDGRYQRNDAGRPLLGRSELE